MRLKNGLAELVLYVIAFAGAAIMLMPFAWMLDTSLKLPEEVQVWPPSWRTENALNFRSIPASIDHSAYSSVNYGAMSLQQMLTSGVSREKELPNVLTVNLVGTAPLRGTLYLKLSEGGSTVKYTTSVNRDRLNSLILKVDSKKYPSKFKNDMEKLKSLELRPIDYLKAFITLFQYTDSPILSRINFINGVSDSAKTSISFFKKFSPLLSKNSKLSIKNSDSALIVKEKKFIKNYFSSDEYTKSVTDFVSNIQRFKKGLGTLASDDANIKSQIENLLSHIDLKETLTKKFGEISPSLLSILNLYKMRAVEPIREWMNLIVSFEDIRKFYNFSKNLEISDPKVTFTFQSLEERKKALKTAFENSGVSGYYLEVADDLIEKENIKDFANLFIKKLNSHLKSSISKMGYSLKKSSLLFGKLADISASMKILYASLSESQKRELDNMVSKESKNFDDLASKINTSFAKTYPNTVKVLVGQLEEDHNFFLDFGENTPKLEGLVEKVWENQKNITKLTNIYNDAYYTMKILKAPPIVSKVQYFPGNGKIKIFFKNINSVWFFDAEVSAKASFSFGEVMANLFQNYVDAWHAAPFARYYLNTVFVATVTTLLNIIIGVMAAFAFSKLRFWGRDFLFMLFLATMMIPGEVLLVPNFITIVKLGWFNTYYALIIPWVASAFVIFLMRQNFMTVPDELFDAAKIDGASKWRFLWTILVPLSRPVIITGALLNFVGSWNAFLWVLIVTNTPSMRTLPVGLQNFSSNAGTMYNQLMAASTFSMLPIVILFLFAQKYFIQGIARSGLK